nr:MAG TPA: hypothetical protein [Crassvirales sp.]
MLSNKIPLNKHWVIYCTAIDSRCKKQNNH